MATVKLVQDTYLLVTHQGWEVKIGVRTKDIGFTIGTELFWHRTGERIAAYRPGTRYGDRAEECAAILVDEAVHLLPTNRPLQYGEFLVELHRAIGEHRDVVDSPWNPDKEDEEDW